LEFHLLGGTIDDAAGEAFDKVANMLGLPFPGGPEVSRVAQTGDPQAFQFPRSFLKDPERLEFSFSGLKTAVRYQIASPDCKDLSTVKLESQQIADLAASFQEAVVDCLVGKSLQALETTGLNRLCVGGGVASNQRFRTRLAEVAKKHQFDFLIAPLELCTDNAVMGAIAFERLQAGLVDGLDLDVAPGLVRK